MDSKIINKLIREWSGINRDDFLNDLNAMHEAEQKLSIEQFEIYQSELGKTCYGKNNCLGWITRDYILATASQRAEALLRTISKWDYKEKV